jgi:hypothetical protein
MLSFVADAHLKLSLRSDGRLVPETDTDRTILDELAATRIHMSMFGKISMRTFSIRTLDNTQLSALLSRRTGLHLYQEAMLLDRPVARYRELWRVLESAFGCTDDELINVLANYEPARQLKFDDVELKRLLVLRGRASHAASRAGINELRSVNVDVSDRIGRLAALVEQVILTKKSWGFPTTAVERLAPLTGFVDASGAITLFQRS